jgi:hypothetical protein
MPQPSIDHHTSSFEGREVTHTCLPRLDLHMPGIRALTRQVLQPLRHDLLHHELPSQSPGGKPRSNHILEVVAATRDRAGPTTLPLLVEQGRKRFPLPNLGRTQARTVESIHGLADGTGQQIT